VIKLKKQSRATFPLKGKKSNDFLSIRKLFFSKATKIA